MLHQYIAPVFYLCMAIGFASPATYSQVNAIKTFDADTLQASLITQEQVWLGNAHGLYKIQGNSLTRFTVKQGLVNNHITALQAGSTGEIWIGTLDGVVKYKHGKFTNFTFKDGLINKKIKAFYQDRQQNLWVVHAKGAQVFDHSSQSFRLHQQLADISVAGIFEQPGSLAFLSNQAIIRLPYQVSYWKTSWFYGILLFLMTSLIVGGIMYYNRSTRQQLQLAKKQAQSEQKALLAQMNPHFIFNALNSIQRFIAHNNVEQASIYLSKFSNLLRITLENSRKGYVSLEDELQNIELYLRLEFLRFENRFTYTIDNQAGWLSQSEIPTMLLQPFVENAIWHGLMNKDSEDGYLKIIVEAHERYLNIRIRDNGVGREKAAQIKAQKKSQHRSRGLEIVQERIELLNNKNDLPITLEIQDLPSQQGTEVTIALPIGE